MTNFASKKLKISVFNSFHLIPQKCSSTNFEKDQVFQIDDGHIIGNILHQTMDIFNYEFSWR